MTAMKVQGAIIETTMIVDPLDLGRVRAEGEGKMEVAVTKMRTTILHKDPTIDRQHHVTAPVPRGQRTMGEVLEMAMTLDPELRERVLRQFLDETNRNQ